MTRGHSNVYNLSEIKPYPTNPDKISIPIQGGASVYTVKNLPDLALDKEEWLEIGKKAGWI
jgi:predicted methyltransferase